MRIALFIAIYFLAFMVLILKPNVQFYLDTRYVYFADYSLICGIGGGNYKTPIWDYLCKWGLCFLFVIVAKITLVPLLRVNGVGRYLAIGSVLLSLLWLGFCVFSKDLDHPIYVYPLMISELESLMLKEHVIIYPTLEDYISPFLMFVVLICFLFTSSFISKGYSFTIKSIPKAFREYRSVVLVGFFLVYWWYFCYYSLSPRKPLPLIDPLGFDRSFSSLDRGVLKTLKTTFTEFYTPMSYFYLKVIVFLILVYTIYINWRLFIQNLGLVSLLHKLILICSLQNVYSYIRYTPRWFYWDTGYGISDYWDTGFRIFPSEEDFVTNAITLSILIAIERWAVFKHSEKIHSLSAMPFKKIISSDI